MLTTKLGTSLASLSTGKAVWLLDVITLLCAWPLVHWLAYAIGRDAFPATHAPSAWIVGLLLYPAANVLALYALGLYRRDSIVQTRNSLSRLPLVVGIGVVATGAFLTFALYPLQDEARQSMTAFACFLLCAAMTRVVFYLLRRRGFFRRRLLVVGAGKRAWDLEWMLRHEGANLNYEIAFLHAPVLGSIDPRLADGAVGPVIEDGMDNILGTAQRLDADEIVVAPDERRGLALENLLACKIAGFPVTQYLSFVEQEIRRVDLKRMELGWLLYSEGFYFGTLDRVFKRGLDLAVSLLLLLGFAPFLLVAAVAIKLDDGGPILYRQERVTRDGRVFRINKLRTMRIDAEAQGAVWAASKDGRVTRVGALLRRTRIDEMPQLFNVLSGDMSLVGPRPERPHFVAMLAEQIPLYRERHVVKAGLTGWAQINYPYGASIDDARSKLSYDLYYVKNFSALFDLLIILQTIRVVLWPSGVR